MLGDNPMQSEFACHIGLRGRKFCRTCNVEGDVEGADEEDGGQEREVAPQAANQSDVSAASDSSVGGDKAAGKQPRRSTKKNETMAEMIQRITNFMNVSNFIYLLFVLSYL